MTKIKKGDDAGDHTPKPASDKADMGATSGKQDSPNYDQLEDDGRSVPAEDMNSANDE